MGRVSYELLEENRRWLELPILSITANLRLGIRSKKIAESQS